MEKQEIDSYIKAGKIHQGVTAFAKSIIKPGMKLYDIAVAIDEKIDELGGEPAFPVNLSINEIAAHFTPAKDDEHVAEGLLKVDIGVAVDGFIADGAFSLDFSEGGKYGEMISLNEKILLEVEKVIKPGMEVCDVGDSVQDSLESWNSSNGSRYSVIKGLSGHQLGQNVIHAGVTISNYRNDNHKKLNDVAIAIEPFVTDG
ncbi:MAG: M24 family metallopeptidase, partial [archaeon]